MTLQHLNTRAEQLYRRDMQAREVPAHLIEGLIRYLVYHIQPGHFLLAVLSSDVREALARADGESQRGLGSIFLFLFKHAPSNAWGSREIVEAWLADRRVATIGSSPDAHLGAVVEASTHGVER